MTAIAFTSPAVCDFFHLLCVVLCPNLPIFIQAKTQKSTHPPKRTETKMEIKVKFLIVCTVIALAHTLPMPQQVVEDVVIIEPTTVATPTRPSRPTRPARPLISALTSAINSINTAFTTAGNLAQNAFGTVTTTGYNVAQSAADGANYFINTAADTFQSGLNTVASTVNQNINLATAPWRPTEAPSIIATDENGVPIPIESLANPELEIVPAAAVRQPEVPEVVVAEKVAA